MAVIGTFVMIRNLVGRMIKRFLILIVACLLLSGCFIFRPKNKCADCPNWGKGGHSAVKHKDNPVNS